MNTFIKKSLAVSLAGLFLAQSTIALALTYTQFSYNNTGRLQTVTLPQGQVHTYGYNQAGEVVSYGLPNATSITFGRDGQGGLTSVSDPRGLLTSYTVSGLREMGYRNSPDTGATSYARDANGLVTSKMDGRGTTTYARDALGRVTSVNYPDATTTFTYDNPMVGKLGNMQDASGSQGFTYNQRGQLLTRTQYVTDPGGANKSFGVQNTYDAAGRLSEITYPSGKRVGYTYDGANVSSISVDGTTVISNVAYQPFGGPSSWVMGGAGTFARTFDTSGRVKTYTFDTGTRTLTWDESNRITAIGNPVGGTWSYGYDNLNRVITANEGTVGNRSFAWDASNNRTSTTIAGANYTYGVNGATNRLATATAPSYAASYQYDTMGQIVSDGARNFTWSGAGNLSSVTSTPGTTSYLYNGMNQRVRKTTGAQSRYYVYAQDGTSVLGEYGQSTPGTPVGAVSEMVYLEGIPVAVMAGGQTYFVHADHLNTPRIIKNNAGAVVWRWDSDAFGNGLANSNPGGVMQFEFNLRFPGQVYDAESGLYYNNARYYDPVTGRYISSDPIGLAGGINTYGYVEGNPLSLVDVTGLRDVIVVIWKAKYSSYVIPGQTGSVGHVYLGELNGDTLLSQFPSPHGMNGKNTTLNWQATLEQEGRSPDEVFKVYVSNDAQFDAAVSSFRDRPEWDWQPVNHANQTNCTHAAYGAFSRGGVQIPRPLILPLTPNDFSDGIGSLFKSSKNLRIVALPSTPW